jgi:hypothetical protein
MMIASPDTLNRFNKESGVDKSMAYLKQHRDSVEWRGGGGFGLEAEAGKGLKLSSGGKAENVSGVRINFPHPPDRPNAKVTILNETNVSLSGGGSAEKGISIGGEAGGEMKVGLERSYELPAGTDVNALLNDPINAPKKVLDAAKNEGKLSETKVQIEGRVAANPKVGVGIGEDGGSSGVNTLPETGFNIEVTLPPGQKLPENFYLNLSRGDIPGAFRGISEDSTFTMKAYQTTKHGYDLEPGFDWEGVSAKSKVQHQRLDQEPIGKTKEGKISELDEEWNEIARQLELR